jgi:hypothetical protein
MLTNVCTQCLHAMSARNVCTQSNQCPHNRWTIQRGPLSVARESSSCCPRELTQRRRPDGSPVYQEHWDTKARESGLARTAHWRMRFEILVRPSGSETSVGGEHDGALVVRVVQPADAGRATEAALRAVAKAVAGPRVGEPRPRCHQPTEADRDRRRVRSKSCGRGRPATTPTPARSRCLRSRPIPGVMGHSVRDLRSARFEIPAVVSTGRTRGSWACQIGGWVPVRRERSGSMPNVRQ